jgi:hypothetical protein
MAKFDEDIFRFLDNRVAGIIHLPPRRRPWRTLTDAAMRERSIGLGVTAAPPLSSYRPTAFRTGIG